jgi:16S rRNA (uracil1498-N3)-methyltransferase
MPRPNQSVQRLYCETDLTEQALISLGESQAHYLRSVVRMSIGDAVLVFNGRDGEWLAEITELGKKRAALVLQTQTRQQDEANDIMLLLAPIKRDRLDYLAQKATEMGASHLLPVVTKRTQNSKLNIERLQANAIEAAEQCNLLHVPKVEAPSRLDHVLADWPADRCIIFCDEHADLEQGLSGLQRLKGQKIAILIGPEGGFDEEERAVLLARKDTLAISLGPRILRADTALVAALALVQSQIGDWRQG